MGTRNAARLAAEPGCCSLKRVGDDRHIQEAKMGIIKQIIIGLIVAWLAAKLFVAEPTIIYMAPTPPANYAPIVDQWV